MFPGCRISKSGKFSLDTINEDENKKHWLAGNPEDLNDRGVQGLVEDLQLKEYKGKYSTPAPIKPPSPICFVQGETFSSLKNHKQIKSVPLSKSDAYQAYIKSDPEQTDDPLAY